MTAVYWIHAVSHTDIFSQGYVGVSKNPELRWSQHFKRTGNRHLKHAIAKHGWDNLVKKVVVIGDQNYCLDIEKKLRPTVEIGWNLVDGGGKPPENKWNKGKKLSAEHCKKLSDSHKGIVYSEESKQKKKLKMTGFKYKQVVCPKCNTKGGETSMKRWHFDNCTGSKVFRARVTVDGKRIHLGRFDSQDSVKMAINNFLQVKG
jgi:hypothetical protein